MELFISFLLVGLFLLYFSVNVSKLNGAFIVFSSILFLVLGVYIISNGSFEFSNQTIDTYTYDSNNNIETITTLPIENNSRFIEVLGYFSILSSIYLFMLGMFKEN